MQSRTEAFVNQTLSIIVAQASIHSSQDAQILRSVESIK